MAFVYPFVNRFFILYLVELFPCTVFTLDLSPSALLYLWCSQSPQEIGI